MASLSPIFTKLTINKSIVVDLTSFEIFTLEKFRKCVQNFFYAAKWGMAFTAAIPTKITIFRQCRKIYIFTHISQEMLKVRLDILTI
jgi:hypothetical protein